MKEYKESDNNADGKIEKDEITNTESKGSYTYEYPNAVLTLAGEKEYMTISGNTMKSKPDEDGEITVFTKK
ncbi:MAG: hypothetical protein RSA92_01635 [Bacteroidaceae bacterium]